VLRFCPLGAHPLLDDQNELPVGLFSETMGNLLIEQDEGLFPIICTFGICHIDQGLLVCSPLLFQHNAGRKLL
jgi:hypothetical protein